MSTKWRGRRYTNQASSSEKKIRLVFILLYWYAENRLGVDLTVNEETEASYWPTPRVVHVRCQAQGLASRGNVIPIYGKTYSKQNQLETKTQYMRLRPSVEISQIKRKQTTTTTKKLTWHLRVEDMYTPAPSRPC